MEMTIEEARGFLIGISYKLGSMSVEYLSEKDGEKMREAISVLEQEPKILDTIDFAINASNGNTNYFVGFRNGLRYTKSLVDGEDPQFEHCAEQEPTTKNDLVHNLCDSCTNIECIFQSGIKRVKCSFYMPPHCQHTDEEIAKSFIEDVEAVKDLLPTTKNDLGVDLISRADAIKAIQDKAKKLTNEDTINGLCGAVAILFDLPPVTPQEPQTFKWCTDCREYDQEKHCCHRWSKVIRDTVEEMKLEYIEREVLDKIRAEITDLRDSWEKDNYHDEADALTWALTIIDKYKAETEVEDGNEKINL